MGKKKRGLIPFICFKCFKTKEAPLIEPYPSCKCGEKMSVHYQSNYQQVAERIICTTCVYSTEGDGHMCDYCNMA